jgi:cation-transporting P-type ATPase C
MESGKTVIYVARNDKPQGIIALENTFRPGTEAVLHRLRRSGIDEIHLISGDHQSVVESLCGRLRFDACEGGSRPEQKASYVKAHLDAGYTVLMVGDGVNDALAFSKADIGAALGGEASETAMESADIVFLTNDLNGIAVLRRLSQRTLRTVEVNFRIAVATNIVGILAGAAGLLAPGTTGLLHIAHVMAIFYNSGRLLKPM